MAVYTALELVNDLIRQFRGEPVTGFAGEQSNAMLQMLNIAIERVLNDEEWDFNVRHDGVLITQASQEQDDGGTILNGFAYGALNNASGLTLHDWTGGGVVRIICTTDATYSNTAFAIVDVQNPGSSGPAFNFVDGAWPGSTAPAEGHGWKIFTAEYVLPSTVQSVLSASYRQSPVNLSVVSASARWDEIVPRPWDSLGGDPQSVVVGGSAVPTVVIGGAGSEGLRGPRMMVFPVPDEAYRIDYSYVYRWPALVEATDTLDGISPSAKASLVMYAAAQANLSSIGNDAELGIAAKRDLVREMGKGKVRSQTAGGQRNRILPYGDRPARNAYRPLGTIPDSS